jgi:hypothetical protein
MAEIVRHSNCYITCAETVAARLRHVFRIPADRISVHYEMIDAGAIAANVSVQAGAELRKKFNLPEEAWIVTGCGTFDLRKAPDLFVQVAARLKRELGPDRPVSFLWIGSQASRDTLLLVREDVRKLGLVHDIQFIDELPSPQGLIAISDLFCLTSREDPFPLVMLEAAALGKPVLGFDGSGGVAEFCAAGGCLTVPYLDVAAMALLARDLLLNPERRTEIGHRAAGVVRDRFVIDAAAPALWAELQKHLQHPPARQQGPRPTCAQIYQTWALDEAPQRSFIMAHLARDRVRERARALANAGQKREAAQILVRAASADIASKDPLVIFESLVEIGDELAPLEPKQSAHLLGEAERIARTNPHLKVEFYRAKKSVSGGPAGARLNGSPSASPSTLSRSTFPMQSLARH